MITSVITRNPPYAGDVVIYTIHRDCHGSAVIAIRRGGRNEGLLLISSFKIIECYPLTYRYLLLTVRPELVEGRTPMS